MSEHTVSNYSLPTEGSPPMQSAAASTARPSGTLRAWSFMPTVAVAFALVGIGYWGHRTGWTMPKFSVLAGRAPAPVDDWCEEHSVAESQCVECSVDLAPQVKEYGWCRAHGIPNCPFEHPDVAQLKSPPTFSPGELERANRALAFAPRPTNNSQCKLHQRRIQFESKAALAKAGVDVDVVLPGPIVEAIAANGEITYDRTRVARLSSRAAGAVWLASKRVGDAVARGEVVALIDAADAGKAKAEFLQALVDVDLKAKTLERLRAAGTAVIERQLREAEAAAQQAQIRLETAEQALVNLGLPVRAEDLRGFNTTQMRRHMQFLGLPDAVTRQLDPLTTTANLLPVVAPQDGIVVQREVVAGEIVDTSKLLYVIADVRSLWLTLRLPPEDAARVDVGQPVRFRTDALREEVTGQVAWISTEVDERTRTVEVRAEIDNHDGKLRANMFGQGRIVLREEREAIVVPSASVQHEGDCHVVFVRDKDYDPRRADRPLVFHVRKVRVGAQDQGRTEIIAGLAAHEVIAVQGSSVLRSELLKNRLGDGCGHHH